MKRTVILLATIGLMYSCETEEPLIQEDINLEASVEDLDENSNNRMALKFSAPIQASPTFGISDNWGNYTLKRIADVNGDGRGDVVAFGLNDTFVALGQANGRFGSPILASHTFAYNDSWGFKNRQVSDVNGDGRADIIGFGNDNTFVALGKANGTFMNPILATTNFGTSDGWQPYIKLVEDINGDGRADIIGFGANNTVVALGQTNGTFSTPFTASNNYGHNTWETKRRLIADLNNDGRGDIVAFGNGGVWISFANTNGTFGTSFMVLANHFHNRDFDFLPLRIADINGDNNLDITAFNTDFVQTFYGQGNGNFTTPGEQAYNRYTFNTGWKSEHIRYVHDINGDNKADIVGFGKHSTIVSLSID